MGILTRRLYSDDSLSPFSPFSPLSTFSPFSDWHKPIDLTLEEAPSELSFLGRRQGHRKRHSSEISDLGDHLEISVDVPGIPPENLSLQLEADNTILLTGERSLQHEAHQSKQTQHRQQRYFKIQRRYGFDDDAIDRSNLRAHVENGVLTITIPKKPETPPQTIPIAIATTKGEKENEKLLTDDAASKTENLVDADHTEKKQNDSHGNSDTSP